MGTWLATWLLGGQPLATVRLKAISQRHFQRSLRVADTRYVVQRKKQGVTLAQHVPPLEEIERLGPCFMVCSRESGMAGICKLKVQTQLTGGTPGVLLAEQELLVTDGPTMFVPGTVDVQDVGQISSFELRSRKLSIGTLALCPAPSAAFTTEGGFKDVQDFPWSAAAEEELNDRLTRLLDGPTGLG
jgi:hypothetical protein